MCSPATTEMSMSRTTSCLSRKCCSITRAASCSRVARRVLPGPGGAADSCILLLFSLCHSGFLRAARHQRLELDHARAAALINARRGVGVDGLVERLVARHVVGAAQ